MLEYTLILVSIAACAVIFLCVVLSRIFRGKIIKSVIIPYLITLGAVIIASVLTGYLRIIFPLPFPLLTLFNTILAVTFLVTTNRSIRKVIEPLQKVGELEELLKQGKGDLTIRLQANANDEVGKLSGSMNEFLARLSALIADIRNESEKTKTSSLS